MAYQKLQVERAKAVVLSDTVDIPNIMVTGPTGTITALAAGPPITLTDNTKDFNALGVEIGMIVVSSRNEKGNIIAVNGDTLTLNVAVLNIGDTYEIFGGSQQGAVLYVGGAGDIKITTAGGDVVTLTGILAGSFIPIQVTRVWSVAGGTTATGILALW